MILYRLSKENYAKDLTGGGAKKSGGRWNGKGTAVLYTSDSRALCTAEIAVHTPLGILPKDFVLITLEINKPSISILDPKSLPKNWRSYPHIDGTQKIGDQFVLDNTHLILKVPSVVVQGEYNFLINPLHKDASKIKIKKVEPFAFDKRLFVK